nr:PREDICTED: sulfhydryl oxidase 1 [Paralichthys olivaceus]
MARSCVRATSRFPLHPRETVTFAAWLCVCLLLPSAAEAGLYTSSDQIISLTPENVESVLVNSTAATMVEFYASWCGHCRSFSPVYKSLAIDIKEWKPAVDLAAIDCAVDVNRKFCIVQGITGYPTMKFFHAYSKADSKGLTFKGFPRDVQGLRHRIIDKLETQMPWPPACPPLEPTSEAELESFFETNNVQHLVLIFEEANSYIGRELTLDLLQFENIAVRRVLSTEKGLVTKLGVTEFPSCFLYYPGGNFTRLHVSIQMHLDEGLVTLSTPCLHHNGVINLFPLCSAVLRLQYFPGRPMVMNLLKSLSSWLQSQTGDEISYEAFKEILDNSAQSPDTALPEGEKWVGCQGSQPQFRRYPCGVWTLFHVLTVQAKKAGSSDPQEVLTAMRNYVSSFFGCRPCAEHFENMARESLMMVNTSVAAILWLWKHHNRVNNRLAGALSEDPNFPKIQWPSPEMCPSCHMVRENGDHRWSQEKVLPFLVSYFSSDSILTDYLENESQILTKQREKQASKQRALEAQKRVERKAREASDFMMHPPVQPTVQEEEEEEEEEEGEEPQDEAVTDEEDEGAEGAAAVDEMGSKTSEPSPWAKPEMELGRRQQQARRKPSIVGMRMRDTQEDIVDLDSFVNQHYKAKALQLAASSRVKQRTLQRKVEQEPGPVFRLGMELDAGLGMVGLQPMEADFDLDMGQKRVRLQKRELTGQYFGEELSHKGHWMSMLSIGFSKVDISLCVILYLLSSMCLLAMYLFFKNRFRLRRVKISLP